MDPLIPIPLYRRCTGLAWACRFIGHKMGSEIKLVKGEEHVERVCIRCGLRLNRHPTDHPDPGAAGSHQ